MLSVTITSSTSLFAALIAVDGTLCESGPFEYGKTTFGDDDDFEYLTPSPLHCFSGHGVD